MGYRDEVGCRSCGRPGSTGEALTNILCGWDVDSGCSVAQGCHDSLRCIYAGIHILQWYEICVDAIKVAKIAQVSNSKDTAASVIASGQSKGCLIYNIRLKGVLAG